MKRISDKKLAKLGGKVPFSTIASKPKRIRKRTRKPIPKVNAEATRKRRLRNQKRMRGAEYRAARSGAVKRSGGRCEHTEWVIQQAFGTGYMWLDTFRRPETNLNSPKIQRRCEETERLQFHEEHYARGRILTKDDGKMLCPPHHRLAESLKPHKQGRRMF